MYLCFIDESNPPPKPNKARHAPYFVIAAVIIHEAQWSGIATELATLKATREFKVRGEIKWRFFGPQNDDADNSVKHLDADVRNQFRMKMLNIITKRNSVKIIYAVCSVKALYDKPWVDTQDDVYFETYKPVSERFQYFLQDISRAIGDEQLGIVVADHQGRKQDQTLRDEHNRMVR